ncbi:MAG: hypothetical protein M3186_16325, partial [Actinomycetota bacterium]|nr:hypothetical protein [Actinomycetota bacterium]
GRSYQPGPAPAGTSVTTSFPAILDITKISPMFFPGNVGLRAWRVPCCHRCYSGALGLRVRCGC